MTIHRTPGDWSPAQDPSQDLALTHCKDGSGRELQKIIQDLKIIFHCKGHQPKQPPTITPNQASSYYLLQTQSVLCLGGNLASAS